MGTNPGTVYALQMKNNRWEKKGDDKDGEERWKTPFDQKRLRRSQISFVTALNLRLLHILINSDTSIDM